MPLGPEDPVPLCSWPSGLSGLMGGNCTGRNGDCALLIPSTLRTLPYGWLSDWQLVEHVNRKMYILPDWKVDIQCRCHATIAIIQMHWGIVWAAGIKQNELTSQLKSALLELNDGVSDGNMRLGMVVQTTLLGKPYSHQVRSILVPLFKQCDPQCNWMNQNKSITRKSIISVLDPFCPLAVSITSTFHHFATEGNPEDSCQWHHHRWLVAGSG